jgi:predicted NBD/HSP70 family sugar kinase
MVDHDGVLLLTQRQRFLKAPVRAPGSRGRAPTIVDNDANAVVAELTHGAAYGGRVLLITLGTGLGGGIVTRVGAVARTASVPRSGTSGRPDGPLRVRAAGHWEASASGMRSVPWRRVGGRGAGARVSSWPAATGRGHGLHVGRPRAGDPAAIELIASTPGTWPSASWLANILDRAHRRLRRPHRPGRRAPRPVRASFVGRLEGAAYRPEVPIVAAALGRHAGVIGAAVLARELS